MSFGRALSIFSLVAFALTPFSSMATEVTRVEDGTALTYRTTVEGDFKIHDRVGKQFRESDGVRLLSWTAVGIPSSICPLVTSPEPIEEGSRVQVSIELDGDYFFHDEFVPWCKNELTWYVCLSRASYYPNHPNESLSNWLFDVHVTSGSETVGSAPLFAMPFMIGAEVFPNPLNSHAWNVKLPKSHKFDVVSAKAKSGNMQIHICNVAPYMNLKIKKVEALVTSVRE